MHASTCACQRNPFSLSNNGWPIMLRTRAAKCRLPCQTASNSRHASFQVNLALLSTGSCQNPAQHMTSTNAAQFPELTCGSAGRGRSGPAKIPGTGPDLTTLFEPSLTRTNTVRRPQPAYCWLRHIRNTRINYMKSSCTDPAMPAHHVLFAHRLVNASVPDCCHPPYAHERLRLPIFNRRICTTA